jgi:hypothetical protein
VIIIEILPVADLASQRDSRASSCGPSSLGCSGGKPSHPLRLYAGDTGSEDA